MNAIDRDDTAQKIAEIREALENCTFPANERLIFVESEEDETTYEIVTERGVVIAKGLDPYDAYLFANAPEWLGFLLSELDKRDECTKENPCRECLKKSVDGYKEIVRELEEKNRKLQEERDEWGRTAQEAINTVFVRDHQLQSAQQEIEALRQERNKLIEGLRRPYVDSMWEERETGREIRRKIYALLKEAGVMVE